MIGSQQITDILNARRLRGKEELIRFYCDLEAGRDRAELGFVGAGALVGLFGVILAWAQIASGGGIGATGWFLWLTVATLVGAVVLVSLLIAWGELLRRKLRREPGALVGLMVYYFR